MFGRFTVRSSRVVFIRGVWRSRTSCIELAVALLMVLTAGCRSVPHYAPVVPIEGDEIVVAGERFHTGTRIVTWLEPGGYNAYEGLSPVPLRQPVLTRQRQNKIEQNVRGLLTLQSFVDQFVVHYDACGVSSRCFGALQARQLSVHFLLDVDGTIYQTLDLQERALHATVANDRSVGIELANIGAYPPNNVQPLDLWYRRDIDGRTALTIPAAIKHPGILTANFQARPSRASPISGRVQGQTLVQYDFTPEQYAALAKLTAALCHVFPKIRPAYPHGFLSDEPVMRKLADRRLARFRGVVGHYHIQLNKIDPGPAFDWRRYMAAVRQELR